MGEEPAQEVLPEASIKQSSPSPPPQKPTPPPPTPPQSSQPAPEVHVSEALADEVSGECDFEEDFTVPSDAELLQMLRSGTPLRRGLRSRVWAELLQIEDEAESDEELAPQAAPEELVQLLTTGCTDCDDALIRRLAAAFTTRHMMGACAGQDPAQAQRTDICLFAALAQLLRYHDPSVAKAIETIGSSIADSLPLVLSSLCGGSVGVARLLLTRSPEGEDGSLLLMCDLMIMEGQEIAIMPFLIATLLLRLVVPPQATFEQLRHRVRREVFGSLGRRDASVICRCMAHARDLCKMTPLTLSTALRPGGLASTRVHLPICPVAPDEALHHVYESPGGDWRLVIVDVRTKRSRHALPVCLRLTTIEDKLSVLEEMPSEDSIHLCFMGDGPPRPKDEAYELAMHLMKAPGYRRHVSVIDGGWPVVMSLAQTLGLDLVRLDPVDEPPPATPTGTAPAPALTSPTGAEAISPTEPEYRRRSPSTAFLFPTEQPLTLNETAASVQQQVSLVTETAALVGQQFKKRLTQGFRALQRLAEVDTTKTTPM